MLIRREAPGDVRAIHDLTARAFARPDQPVPVEASLVEALRADVGWIPALSLVAELDGGVVGHVVCTRADLDGTAVLGLGPLSVDPPYQARGAGSALMHAVLGAADALDEPLVVLLGNPAYYRRFGFGLAGALGIEPPVADWAPAFQARALSAYQPAHRGSFTYAAPFSNL